MDPGRAVELAIQGPRARSSTGVTKYTLAELERAYGGPKGAASAAGVSRETWRRWRLGTQKPKAANVQGMSDALHTARLGAIRKQHLTHGRPLIYLHGVFEVSAESRERCGRNVSRVDGLRCQKFMLNPSSTQYANLVDAYTNNDHAAMDQGLQDIVGSYVADMVVTDVHTLWMGAAAWTGSGDDEDDDE